MFQKFFIASAMVLLCLSSCKKDDDNDDNQPTPAAPDYYMNFSYNGTTYNMDSDILQYGHTRFFSLGGYVPEATIASGNNGSIEIWFQDSVKNLDLEQELIGKKIYFNENSGPYPYASVSISIESGVYYPQRPADSSFYLQIDELEYLGTDEYWGSDDIGVYTIKGDFRANLDDGNGGYTPTTGEFFMQCSMELK